MYSSLQSTRNTLVRLSEGGLGSSTLFPKGQGRVARAPFGKRGTIRTSPAAWLPRCMTLIIPSAPQKRCHCDRVSFFLREIYANNRMNLDRRDHRIWRGTLFGRLIATRERNSHASTSIEGLSRSLKPGLMAYARAGTVPCIEKVNV